MLKPVAVVVSLLALAGAAQAQPPQGQYSQPPQGPYNRPADQGPAQEEPGPDLNALRDALRLQPGQQADWRAYVAAITPDPAAEARHRQAALMLSTLSTPRRIDLLNAEMEEDVSAMRRQGEAVKAFYSRLTPEQQHIFDVRTAPQAEEQGAQRR